MPGEKPAEASLDWKPIQRRDRESNPDSVVHSAEEVPLRYLLPQIMPDVMTQRLNSIVQLLVDGDRGLSLLLHFYFKSFLSFISIDHKASTLTCCLFWHEHFVRDFHICIVGYNAL